MTKEEMLKQYILTKYKSLREFTQKIDMPYSTMTTILRNGINNANVQNIIKICNELEISVDDLEEGRIVPVQKEKPAQAVDLAEVWKDFLNRNLNIDAEKVLIYGDPVKTDDIMLLKGMLDDTFETYMKHEAKMRTYRSKLMDTENE